MKRGVLLLALCGAVLLSGCAAMLERSHVSSTAHADYAVVEDDSVLRAETYQGLVSSLLYFIREHSEGGAIRLYNYTGDVEADLVSARDEVLEQDPIGAYAVDTLDYDSTRILTYYEVEVSISYSHTAQEVEDVKPLASVSALRKELDRMAAERQDRGTFLVSYFSGDAGLVDTLLWHSICNTPELYSFPAGPGEEYYSVALYPETGTRRIVEVSVDWRTGQEEARRRARETEWAAAAFLEANHPEGEAYTPTELAGLLLAAVGLPDRSGTSIPLEVLTGGAPNATGFLLTAEYLCRCCGIEAVYVLGEPPRPDLFHWLIVSTPEGYRHMTLEPSDGGEEDPDREPFRLYTDQEMLELGYGWNTALYPACVGEPSGGPPEEGETEPVPAETDEARG